QPRRLRARAPEERDRRPGEEEHRREPHCGEHGLAEEDGVRRGESALVRCDRRRGQHHDESDDHQCDRRGEYEIVGREGQTEDDPDLRRQCAPTACPTAVACAALPPGHDRHSRTLQTEGSAIAHSRRTGASLRTGTSTSPGEVVTAGPGAVLARGAGWLVAGAAVVAASLLLPDASTALYLAVARSGLKLPYGAADTLLILLAVGFLLAAWGLRRVHADRLILALLVGSSAVAAYLTNEALKLLIAQQRPCIDLIVDPRCP